MATKTFDVTVTTNIPQKITQLLKLAPPKKHVIAYAATQGRETAERESKGRHGTKGFRGRMETTFEQDDLVARIRPQRAIAGIAFTVSQGRRPGRGISLKAFAPWAGRAGIQVYRTEGRRRYTAEYVNIRELIKARGTTPVPYMEHGEEAANKAIRDGIPKAEREMERDWNA